MEVVDYSEKAIALIGETRDIKEQLKLLGGKFNPYLNINNEKVAGWIFPKTKKSELQKILNGESNPDYNLFERLMNFEGFSITQINNIIIIKGSTELVDLELKKYGNNKIVLLGELNGNKIVMINKIN